MQGFVITEADTPGNIWLGKYMKVAHCSPRYLFCAEICSNNQNS
jgi:hypothetical protein